jgi:hypothetical protein
VKEQREQRTSSNMVSAKTLANGYQPSRVKRGGKAKPYLGSQPKQPAAPQAACPQQNTNQPTKNPHPPPPKINLTTHLFFAVFF